MKQIIQKNFNGIDNLEIVETTNIKKSPFSAIIKTKYIPILPWDWMGEEGRLQGIHPVQLPTTIGYSFSGIVQEVGSLRNQKLVGQAVFGANPGGTASEVINSQIPPIIFPVPKGVSLPQAATIIGGADTAWHAINDILHVSTNDHVLIIGASGGVGQYLVQLAKLQHATITGMASKKSQKFVQKLGIDEFIAYDENLHVSLKTLGNVTKIIDAVGNAEILTEVLQRLNDVEVLSLSQTSFTAPKINQHFQFSNGRIALKNYSYLASLIGNGELTAYVHRIFPFEEVVKAQKMTKMGHSQGRSLLSFNED